MESFGARLDLKKKFLFTCAAILLFVCQAWAQGTLPGVYSTGVDASGNVLPAGQTDPHYTITSSPLGATSATTVAFMPVEWAANTASSGWINATGSGNDIEALGNYTYTLSFSMNGFDLSTAEISGEWTSDNESEIFFNGVDTGFFSGTNGFGAFSPFSITNGFVSGQNQLQFVVTQEGGSGPINPEGLQVNITSATASPVPEPATFSLLGLAGLLLGKLRRNQTTTPSQGSPDRRKRRAG